MRATIRGAEIYSCLVFLMLGLGNPHGELMIYLVAALELAAAVFIIRFFPAKGTPFVTLGLAVAVVITFATGLFGGGGGGAGLHSPIMGIDGLINALLLLAQIVAAICAIVVLLRSNGDGGDDHLTIENMHRRRKH